MQAKGNGLTCRRFRQKGKQLARWSAAEIVRRLVTLGTRGLHLGEESVTSAGSSENPPWHYHTCQHVQDPEAFLVRARPVLWLCERVQITLVAGVWGGCADEKTLIWARTR